MKHSGTVGTVELVLRLRLHQGGTSIFIINDATNRMDSLIMLLLAKVAIIEPIEHVLELPSCHMTKGCSGISLFAIKTAYATIYKPSINHCLSAPFPNADIEMIHFFFANRFQCDTLLVCCGCCPLETIVRPHCAVC